MLVVAAKVLGVQASGKTNRPVLMCMANTGQSSHLHAVCTGLSFGALSGRDKVFLLPLFSGKERWTFSRQMVKLEPRLSVSKLFTMESLVELTGSVEEQQIESEVRRRLKSLRGNMLMLLLLAIMLALQGCPSL